MSTIYFIRHGQASFGRGDYDRLSATGFRQAELLGDYLKRLGAAFETAWSGTLNRQRDTARVVLDRLGIAGEPRIEADLDEHDTRAIIASQWRHLTDREPGLAEDYERMFVDEEAFKRVYRRTMLRWMAGRFSDPQVEPYARFVDRVERITRRLMASEADNVLVFTSGGPISTVMRLALGLADEQALALTWRLRNASVSTFQGRPESLRLVVYNQVAHLEARGEPDLITYR
jgi:broad specificity phosphatase PhoE